MTKRRTNALNDSISEIKRMRLHWGEVKVRTCLMMTPSGYQLLRTFSEELQISKSDLMEYLTRSFTDPVVREVVKKQIEQE